MRVTKLILSYDGTDFCGWQRQPDERTVQGVVEDALAELSGKRIPVAGAGRTDAGVHAQGQVASFRAEFRLKNDALRRALNALLPGDVRVLSAGPAPPGFDARRSARSKVYRYRIFNGPRISPFLFRYVLHWTGPLDLEKMAEAAGRFVRAADFTAFSSNRLLHPVRRVSRSELHKKGSEIIYTVEADGFLRYMVRTIVGTLLEVGRGKIDPRAIEDLFAGKRRSLRSPTAPAKGLCLVKVIY
ncbi:MAG TPA: tRNA pseudouridine(38-40) synthase TruA [Candidatus Desulfaltia sp.]|nr:tRNA pseudouridine(38-40) synthase TruA [Candidatus Desulfaltia sp.]